MAAIEGIIDSVDDRILEEDDDFFEVREAVDPVIHKWRSVGGALGVQPTRLKTIQATHPTSLETCMDETLLVWLRRSHNEAKYGPPTWKKLVQAIAAKAGGQNVALAEKIAKDHQVSPGSPSKQHPVPESASVVPSQDLQVASGFTHPKTTPTLPPPVPHCVPYTTDKDGSPVPTGESGVSIVRFSPHQSASEATAIEFSFGQVEVKQGQPQSGFELYKMRCFPHGLCVIINNEQFKEHSERQGTLVDEHNLTQCFRYLGYTVEVHRNCTAQQIEALFGHYQTYDHSSFDSLVVCILSHGEEGHVFGADSKSVSLRAIVGKLNPESCPSLAGKPKVFFIQACRGGDRTQGTQIVPDSGGPGAAVLHSSEAVRVVSDSRVVTIPDDADFFFGNATPPGKVAWRDMDYGSWYVSELCRSLCSHATYADLVSMVTEVHNEVGTRYNNQSFKQAPEATSRLRKKILFFDK